MASLREPSIERQVAGFMARYDAGVAGVAREAVAKLRKLLPGAVELVYDNYNALVIAFGPSDRTTDVILSVALYPRWVNLFFARGADLRDPKGLLQGSGTRVRRILLETAATVDHVPVRALIRHAVESSSVRLDKTARRRMIVKAVSARQRPRRPAAGSPGRYGGRR